jgi:hypothetical protein
MLRRNTSDMNYVAFMGSYLPRQCSIAALGPCIKGQDQSSHWLSHEFEILPQVPIQVEYLAICFIIITSQ